MEWKGKSAVIGSGDGDSFFILFYVINVSLNTRLDSSHLGRTNRGECKIHDKDQGYAN